MSPSEQAVEAARREALNAVEDYGLRFVGWSKVLEAIAAFEAAVRADEAARLQASDEASAMPLDPA